MIITKTIVGNTINLGLSGRLDTVTSSQLSSELGVILELGFKSLVFDFSELVYISSAGLRVLLTAQKKVNITGAEMKIVGASEDVKEVFEITGFTSIMTVE